MELAGGYSLQKASAENHDEIVTFIKKDFLPVVTGAVDVNEEEQVEMIENLASRTLSSGFCYVIRDSRGEIAALKLAANRTRGPSDPSVVSRREAKRRIHPIHEYIAQSEEKMPFWSFVPPSVSLVNYVSLVSVDSNHRRKGLADVIMRAGHDDVIRSGAEAHGARSVTVGSQKLFVKYGYTPVCELLYSTILDADDRQIVNCKEGTDRVQLMFMDLRGKAKI